MVNHAVDSEEVPPPPHLVILGGGVAGCAAASWAASHGAKVTLINAGLPLGGTCIHTGTFPARLLMTAATEHYRAANPRFPGLYTEAKPLNWRELSAFRRSIVDEIRRDFQHHLVDARPNVELIEEYMSFVDPQTVRVGSRSLKIDRLLLTPGSQSTPPEIEGLNDVNAMKLAELVQLESLPEKLIFLETSDVAIVYAQLMARLGCEVQILTEKSRLFGEDYSPQITSMMTDFLSKEGVQIHNNTHITHAERREDGLRALGTQQGHPRHWDGEALVIVDHHRPRTDGLGLEKADIELDEQGFIIIDETLQTTNPHVFAAGDAIGRVTHAYASAYDAILASRNAISKSRTAGHATAIPFAIYTDPQLAGVGWNEEQAMKAGFESRTVTVNLDQIPATRALGYETGFIQLCCDRRSDHLLGARILGPNASELIMEVSMAIRAGLTVSELATMVHPAIALGDGIARAAALLR